ncbi:MAG: type 1 glutamine amidotransferase domain-containing protein [Planctomycetota bacterium]
MLRVVLSALIAITLALPALARDAPRVGIVLTNHAQLGDTGKPTGFYLSEAAWPWKTFTDAGYDVVWLSPAGGPAPIDPSSLGEDDAASVAFLQAVAADDHTVATEKIGDRAAEAFAAVFVAGGHGTMWDLPDHRPLQELLAGVYENNGVVAAVCHGPAALVNVRLGGGDYLVAGKRVAAFTDAEEQAVGLTEVVPFLLSSTLQERGAELVHAENFAANVVVSERLVTGQNPASAQGTAEAVAKLLNAE